LGGQADAGKGIKIADVDTGLDVLNPMFSGTGFTAPAGYPKGFCVTNSSDTTFQCNDKVIVGRWFYDTALVGGTTILDPKEVMTPADIEAHGSHTAGTAAGDPVTAHVQGIDFQISGVAPAAYLMIYKSLFGVITNGTPGGSGTDAMLVAGLDAALADGADVINNSWGGGAGDPNASLYKPLIANITAAGTLVVFAAGNAGPNGGTIGCPGCVEDALTVAASTTDRIVANPFNVTGPTPVPSNLTNLGIFSSGQVIAAPISEAIRYDAADALGCVAFPSNTYFTGSIALIGRGTCTFATKVGFAQAAGADAVVIFNNAGGPPVGMSGVPTTFPSYMIDMTNGRALRDFILANPITATATIGDTITKVNNPAYQDVMAGFSSVGPDGDPNVLKPDITAPGVNILSAVSPALIPGGTEPSYAFYQGTSMATPHITGSAALLMQQHPDWTPWQVRTALTSTAVQTLVKPDGVTPATPFNMGSGRVDLARAGNAGLTFNKSSFANANCLLTCSWTLNVKNVTGFDERWDAVTTTPSNHSFALTATPASIDLPAGASMDVTVTADASQLLPDGYVFGSVAWKSYSQKYPDAYFPVVLASGTTSDASIINKTVSASTANQGDTLTYSINVANNNTVQTTYTVSDQLPPDLVYQNLSATGGLSYDPGTHTLTGQATLAPINLSLVPTGTSTIYQKGDPATSLDLLPYCSSTDVTCDEDVFDIGPVDIYYLGVHYTDVMISSNGFLAFGSTAVAPSYLPQQLPDPTTPNNVIAPLWTDLDFGAATSHWLVWNTATQTVFEWQNAEAFGTSGADLYNFEIWFTDGTSNITFAYGPLDDDLVHQNPDYIFDVGAENASGSTGMSYYYFDGINPTIGIPPAQGTDLQVVNAVASATMTFQANVDLTQPKLPVVTNMATEVNNNDAIMNAAVAYTTIQTYTELLPIIMR
jgi:uncharacterized repeat protein (TIGR01451 family)